MAGKEGSSESHTELQPIDVRVAKFLAEIQADSQGTARSNFHQIQISSEQQDSPEQGWTDQGVVTDQEEIGSCRRQTRQKTSGRSSGTKKHRYRDDRQKLSNSMAQKRYRERKKRAFDELKNLVECLQVEVEQLTYLKAENQRLALTLEQYKQMVQQYEHKNTIQKAKSSSSDLDANTEVLVCSSPPLMTTNLQTVNSPMALAVSVGLGSVPQPQQQQQLLLSGLEELGPIGVMKHICARGNTAQLDSCTSLAARVEFLETEWYGRMSAVEQLLKFQRACDATTLGTTSSNDLKSIMKDSMTNMFSLHSELASAKLLYLSEEVQANNNRIAESFAEFIDEERSK
eukprot:g8643.t1